MSSIGISAQNNFLQVTQTAQKSRDRLTAKNPIPLDPARPKSEDDEVISVSLSTTYQRIRGFGGAFTDSTAYLFNELSEEKQAQVIDAYFGDSGNKYSLCRLQIGSSDFAVSHYNYNNMTGDYSMSNFTIAHDEDYIIPMIKQALKKTAESGRDLSFLSTPWSPPAWLKRNNRMANSLMPGLVQEQDSFEAWSLYFSKYLSAYKEAGVEISYVTVQNEPHVATQFAVTYECCGFEATDQRDFLRDYLGPRLRADHPDVKIFIHDDQKDDRMIDMVNAAMQDPIASKYVDGVAFHWYGDFLDNYDVLDEVHSAYPDLPLLGTEATLMRPETQFLPWNHGWWAQGQYYAVDIIRDLNHNAEGWVDWNMLLDRSGGPSSQHLGGQLTEKDLLDLGNCDAPIRLNLTGYPRYDELDGDGSLIFGSAYWHFGHFSRFLPPGSIRVGSSSSKGADSSLEFVSFVTPPGTGADTDTPSGELVTIVLNANEEVKEFTLSVPDYGSARLDVPAQGIQTLTLVL